MNYDVVIVGASFGGVSAALAAARYGKSVALIDAGGNVGGQATSQGLTRWDESAPVLTPNTYGSSRSYQTVKSDVRGWYRAYTKLAPGVDGQTFNPGFSAPAHPFSADCNVTETVLRQLLARLRRHDYVDARYRSAGANVANGTIQGLRLGTARPLPARSTSTRPTSATCCRCADPVGDRSRGAKRHRGTARRSRRRTPVTYNLLRSRSPSNTGPTARTTSIPQPRELLAGADPSASVRSLRSTQWDDRRRLFSRHTRRIPAGKRSSTTGSTSTTRTSPTRITRRPHDHQRRLQRLSGGGHPDRRRSPRCGDRRGRPSGLPRLPLLVADRRAAR